MTVIPRGSWPDHPRHDPHPWAWVQHHAHAMHPLRPRDVVIVLALVLASVILAAAGIAWLDSGHSGTDINDAGRWASAPVGGNGRHA